METRLLTEVEIVRGPPPPSGTPLLPRGKERPVGLETVIEKRSSLLPPSSLDRSEKFLNDTNVDTFKRRGSTTAAGVECRTTGSFVSRLAPPIEEPH